MISRWIDRHIQALLLAPAVIFIVFMVALPLLFTVYLSFTSWSMSVVEPPRWIMLENYRKILQEQRIWNAAGRTVYFAFAATLIEMLLGTGLALFLNRKFRANTLTKTVMLLPMVATPVAISFVWLLLYEPTIGLLNYFLEKLGLPSVMWLIDQKIALHSYILIDVWQWTPMIMLIVLGGLASLPTEPYEAAIIDGANRRQILFRITLPLLAPTLLVGMMIRLVDALKVWDTIYAMTGGGPNFSTETLNILIYITGMHYMQLGRSSAMIVLLLVIISVICFVIVTARKKFMVEQ